MKTWTERRMFTEEQIVTIQPNETLNGVVLKIEEPNPDNKTETRLYLSYEEAKILSAQIMSFVDERI